MPPKRIIKNNVSSKPKPPPILVKPNHEQDNGELTEAELKFDQEVLWCISQFEKILGTGKLPEAKKQESIKAMNTLKKSTVPKIQKIQLMRQYFKDVKSKMQKDEEMIKDQAKLNFQLDEDKEINKGVFVKKKSKPAASESASTFLFNFKDPSDAADVMSKLNQIELSQ